MVLGQLNLKSTPTFGQTTLYHLQWGDTHKFLKRRPKRDEIQRNFKRYLTREDLWDPDHDTMDVFDGQGINVLDVAVIGDLEKPNYQAVQSQAIDAALDCDGYPYEKAKAYADKIRGSIWFDETHPVWYKRFIDPLLFSVDSPFRSKR